jgi:hypothetical protein
MKFLKLRLFKINRAANLNRPTKLFTFSTNVPVTASCSVSAKISDSEENLPSDVELGNQSAIDRLILLAKSKERYEIQYKYFVKMDGSQENSCKVSETMVLAYFAEQSGKLKPSSLWSRLLRTLVSI